MGPLKQKKGLGKGILGGIILLGLTASIAVDKPLILPIIFPTS